MSILWKRFLAPLTAGARMLLLILTVLYVVAVAGVFSHAYNLYNWLALSGPAFWKGQIWLIVTYALLPASLLDFLFNWILILFLGSWLERAWSRSQLWTYCLVAAAGAGLAKVLVQPASPFAMVGTTPIVFGLLVAWGKHFGHEKVLFWFIWEMTVRQAAVLLIAISFLVMLPCAGLVNASIMLCGGVGGWLYLGLQSRLIRARRSQTVASERMGRLEL
jgi:membrane associated rhomboid family serine protease